MNATRSKKTRHASRIIFAKFGDNVIQACKDKFEMPNRFGRRQHLVINPKRQLKKMVLREKIS